MIELPESVTLARQLNETVRGKRIAEVEIEHTHHAFAWYNGTQEFYSAGLEGKVFGESVGLGMMLESSVEDKAFVIGDGTHLQYFAPGERLPEKYQARVSFQDGSSLLCKVQMYGMINLYDPKTEKNPYYLAGKSKPQPGTEGFCEEYFRNLMENVPASLSAKAFLATEQRIPGLGNGVLQDILWRAGIHPKRKMAGLTGAQWQNLYDSVVEVLLEMTLAGGRDTEKTLFGRPGGYHVQLSKNTVGMPCPRCGALLEKANYMGGSVYFCPGCQEI